MNEIELLKTALRLAAGELSTYRDTDKHPQETYDRLRRSAELVMSFESGGMTDNAPGESPGKSGASKLEDENRELRKEIDRLRAALTTPEGYVRVITKELERERGKLAQELVRLRGDLREISAWAYCTKREGPRGNWFSLGSRIDEILKQYDDGNDRESLDP